MRRKAIEYNGVKYPTIKEAAEVAGVNYFTVIQRLTAGVDPWTDRQLGRPGTKVKVRLGKNGRKTFATIRAAADHFGVEYMTYYQRIMRGITPTKAGSKTRLKPQLEPVTADAR